jgi:hypothetical protein
LSQNGYGERSSALSQNGYGTKVGIMEHE